MNTPTHTIDQRRMAEILANAKTGRIDPMKLELIQLTISAAVPLNIANLLEIGGPQDYHIEDITERLHHTQGDGTGLWSGFADMMMGGKQSREEIILLCDVLAVLAFYPGGVTAFGLHFEATAAESEVSA
jgi:hypothetical protein